MHEFKKGIGILLQKHPDINYIPVYMLGMVKVLPKGEKQLVLFDTFVRLGIPSSTKATEIREIVLKVEVKIIALGATFIQVVEETNN
jgi:hypothetical protein